MAQHTEIRLISDLSGGFASSTVKFGLDGRYYEIDLTTDESNTLHLALAPYVGAARKAGSSPWQKSNGQKQSTSTRGQNSNPEGRYHTRIEAEQIREWARENGIRVAPRGRISIDVLKQYENRDSFVPPPPVTDEEIVRWVRATPDLGVKVVGGRCTARLRELYVANHPGAKLAHGMLASVPTAVGA